MNEQVVLLHGIWMRGFTLSLLARRLRATGYEVSSYNYASVTRDPGECVARVAEYLAALPPGPVHLVGHSLGGLLSLELARAGHLRRGGRIVCLGTPLRGSAVARVLSGWAPLRWTLGEAKALLCGGLDTWPAGVEVGMIAGRVPVGIGLLIPGLERPHDGTVAVAETRADDLTAHAVIANSHTGLLLSDEVARLVARFIADGRFPARDH